MKKAPISIAVTSVGGGVGQSIVKALTNTEYHVVGLDADPLAAGLYTVPSAYIIPHSKDKQYISRLLEICQKERCRILFPGSDTELMTLSQHVADFANIGTTVVVSKEEVIDLADDKLKTARLLAAHGIPTPQTYALSEAEKQKSLTFPLILKPMVGGSRSKNIQQISSKEKLQSLLNQKDQNYVLQEYIEGDEYTCGSVNLDGRCHGVIVMRRILRDGDTYKCFSEENPLIEKTVRTIMEVIQPFGACNVQLRMKDGKPYVFEINARCSGTTGARALCGFNEPLMIADYLCHGKKPTYKIQELSILRYWKELVVDNAKIQSMQSEKEGSHANFPTL